MPIKHGMSTWSPTRPRIYEIWKSMRNRCHDKKRKDYAGYGGRGIFVCDRWRHDFTAFLADMGHPPPGHSIDRIDSTKGYSPENCRWTTTHEQTRNTIRNVFIEHDGQRLCLTDWAAKIGISSSGLSRRYSAGDRGAHLLRTPKAKRTK